MTEAILVVCPMETVKVRLIHDQSTTKRYKGLVDGIATIVREEGRSRAGRPAAAPR